MKKSISIPLFALVLCASSCAQNNTRSVTNRVGEKSIVLDSNGNQYPYQVWHDMVMAGDYTTKPVTPTDENTSYLLVRLTDAQKAKRLATKPKESPFFKTGNPFPSFEVSDIKGTRYNIYALKGKIVVLNFWFINCGPCRKEIPELNKLVQENSGNDNVVFLGIALDDKYALQQFLETTPFQYNIIADGRYLVNQYGIKTYPTNAVIDQAGNVYFHTAGYGLSTVHWIKKSIEALQQQPASSGATTEKQ